MALGLNRLRADWMSTAITVWFWHLMSIFYGFSSSAVKLWPVRLHLSTCADKQLWRFSIKRFDFFGNWTFQVIWRTLFYIGKKIRSIFKFRWFFKKNLLKCYFVNFSFEASDAVIGWSVVCQNRSQLPKYLCSAAVIYVADDKRFGRQILDSWPFRFIHLLPWQPIPMRIMTSLQWMLPVFKFHRGSIQFEVGGRAIIRASFDQSPASLNYSFRDRSQICCIIHLDGG